MNLGCKLDLKKIALHARNQPEEDQQILPHNSPIPTQRQQQQQNGFGLALPHQQINTASSSQNLYSLPGFTPQYMLQPQTPVIYC